MHSRTVAGSRTSMDLHHNVHHGRHRQRWTRLRIALISVSLALFAGASIAALLWTLGPSTSGDPGQAAPSSTASESTTEERQTEASRTTGSPAPAASAANPVVGPAVATGMAPHDMAIAP